MWRENIEYLHAGGVIRGDLIECPTGNVYVPIILLTTYKIWR
jgi:hypothetical protein